MRSTMTTIKLLLLVFSLSTSCVTLTEAEWRRKKMLKQDRKMIRKVHNVRKFKTK
jgi:hypothetical protein